MLDSSANVTPSFESQTIIMLQSLLRTSVDGRARDNLESGGPEPSNAKLIAKLIFEPSFQVSPVPFTRSSE